MPTYQLHRLPPIFHYAWEREPELAEFWIGTHADYDSIVEGERC